MSINPHLGQPVCDVCGGEPAGDATFRSVLSLLIAWQVSTRMGNFCRDCGVAVHREMTKFTMVAGWWGFAVLGALVVILMNASAAARLERMPSPTERPGRPLVPGPPISRSPALIVPLLFLTLILVFCCGIPDF
ncbi:hypothetical protein [Catenuloplanes japonicus]|uniref:hypothetical protein n=1 Tax=Catenuloplanes japonicus TaxID=33876 RepID=UPI0005251A56|nr:hypothetical protein [Catenuloplanes japonicus]